MMVCTIIRSAIAVARPSKEDKLAKTTKWYILNSRKEALSISRSAFDRRTECASFLSKNKEEQKMKKNTINFRNLDAVGACNRRKQFDGVRLTTDASLQMEQALITKQMVILALAARAVRGLADPDVLQDMYEECVLPAFSAGLTDEEIKCYHLLVRMLISYARMFAGDEPEDIRELLDCDVPGKVRELISRAFKRLNWPTHRTAEVNAAKAAAKVSRYLAWETRTAMFPEPKEVVIQGTVVKVAPDFAFDSGMDEVTLVTLNTGKPRLTQGSKTMGFGVKSAGNSLQMYALWLYGKNYLLSSPDTDVVACALSLTRADDTSRELQHEFTAPSGARNVVILARNPKESEEQFQSHFGRLMDTFNRGLDIECNKKDCSMCQMFPICSFKKEPLRLDDEFVVKKAREVTLSKAQSDVVYFRNGIARVNAGAGAGKTLVMSLFVTTLLDDGVDPEDILCITFTRGAADELGSRIAALVDDFEIEDVDPSKVMCTTFNGFGAAIIDKKYRELGFDKPPVIVDVERKKLIEELLDRVTIPGLDYATFQATGPSKAYGALDVVCAAFDEIKKQGASFPTAEDLRSAMTRYSGSIYDDAAYEAMVDLFYVYEEQMRKRGFIEFADQEDLLWQLIARDPYFLEDILPFKYVVVDEFQDSNRLQIELVKQFTYAKDFRALVVCGDDSQSIFSYRGAVPDNLIHFFEKMGVEDGVDLPLLENYRCRAPIIEYANKINALNKNRVVKDLIATRGAGKPVEVKGFHSRKTEHDYIASVVRAKLDEGYKPEDIAVLAATGAELGDIASRLHDIDVPGIMMCPEQCLDNAKILGAVGLRHALKSPGNSGDIALYLNAVNGGKAVTWTADELDGRLQEMADAIVRDYRSAAPKEKSLLFQKWLDAIDPDGKDSIFQDFKARIDAKRALRDKFEFIDLFYRFGGQKMKRPGKYPGVVLSTVHSAKGLEWPVCIVSLSKFEPYRLSEEDMEEKRRLLFVAATRAREELFVTGQYVAYKAKENLLSKKASAFYNRLLRESFEVQGLEYDPVDHEAEAEKQTKRRRKSE